MAHRSHKKSANTRRGVSKKKAKALAKHRRRQRGGF